MKLTVSLFKGRAPRISPRALPDGFAQIAANARLLSGDLESWNIPLLVQALVTKVAGAVNSIFLLSTFWLNWVAAEVGSYAKNVDVALGPIAGDTSFRFYFTGTDAPRVSNLCFATNAANQGSNPAGAYPYKSYLLGVPAPTSAPVLASQTFTGTLVAPIAIANGTDPSTWNLSPQVAGVSTVTSDGSVGTNPPMFKMFQKTTAPVQPPGGIAQAVAYLNRNLGMDGYHISQLNFEGLVDTATTAGSALVYDHDLVVNLLADETGKGPGFYIAESGAINIFPSGSGFGNTEGALTFIPAPLFNPLVVFTVNVKTTLLLNGKFTLSVNVVQASTGTNVTGTLDVTARGGYAGFACKVGAFPPGAPGGGTAQGSAWVDTVNFAGTNPTENDEETTYVYTWINVFGEESEPSPALVEFLRASEGFTYSLTGIADPTGTDPANYGLTNGAAPCSTLGGKRLYRAVTGTSGTSFQLVNTEGDIVYGTTTYNDTKTDAQLGEVLPSTDYALPPSDMQGILSLPNGITAGFSKNELCLSAVDVPSAWPFANRYATDYPIVGIGAIDTAVVILTTSKPYVAYGTAPDGYTLSKIEFPQGCVSKRSIAYLRGVGVVYATETGLYAISGISPPRNLTEGFFTQREWKALSPETMIGSAHEDNYYASYNNGTKGAFVLESREGGHGFADLSFYFTAVFNDESIDALDMVLDTISQPTAASSNALPTPDSKTVYKWDAGSKINYQWRSKLFQLAEPTTFKCAQVKALDYTNLVLRLRADGVQVFEKTITSAQEFVLPDVKPANQYEIELAGSSRVTQVEVAETVEELS